MARMKHARRFAAATILASLAACQGSGASLGGSPEGVPIALESIDGAPAPVRTALIGELATAASSRKVELVGSNAQARYRVRGYLSTETAEGETRVSYVWDVFDSEKRRAKRLAGSSPVQVSSRTLSALDKETLAKLAGASMDEIAEFLSAAKAETPFQTADVAPDQAPVAAQ
jgi:hypothetical protein